MKIRGFRRNFWVWCTLGEKILLASTASIWFLGLLGLLAGAFVLDLTRGNAGMVVCACYLFGAPAGIAIMWMVGVNVGRRQKHDPAELPPKTERSVLRQAGLEKD